MGRVTDLSRKGYIQQIVLDGLVIGDWNRRIRWRGGGKRETMTGMHEDTAELKLRAI